jgi:hypothetical protein
MRKEIGLHQVYPAQELTSAIFERLSIDGTKRNIEDNFVSLFKKEIKSTIIRYENGRKAYAMPFRIVNFPGHDDTNMNTFRSLFLYIYNNGFFIEIY